MSSRFLRVIFPLVAVTVAAAPAAAQQMRGNYPQSYFRPAPQTPERLLMMQLKELDHEQPKGLPALTATGCVGGDAGGYPCNNIDLLSFLPLDQIGGGSGNDIWGWTDPLDGKEYALFGRTTGTAFIDVSDPENPIFLGDLPTHTASSTWRDIKVYENHAFIVSEAKDHGMQVFDLTQLRSVTNPPVSFVATVHYADFGSAHNIVINEAFGQAYAVGTNTCAGGLHIVNIQTPTAPTFAGCFDADGYTHDAQCVTYNGPDTTYTGRQICLGFNEDTLTVVDATDASGPIQISRTGYTDRGYTHQGWLTDDHRWALMDDELDEARLGATTRTLVWDLTDLDAPVHAFTHDHEMPAIDHNLYVKGDYVYESNYRAGLRILSLECLDSGVLTEVGFFDIYPANDNTNFSGTWSNYPYFSSGIVIVSGIGEGLFVLRPNLTVPLQPPTSYTATDTGSNQIDLDWDDVPATPVYSVERSEGGCGVGPWISLGTTAVSNFSDTTVSGLQRYGYRIQAIQPLGCSSQCIEVDATGDCFLRPNFSGANGVANLFGSECELEVRWPAGTGRCTTDIVYNIYRDTAPGFTPDASTRVASCVAGNAWLDTTVVSGTRYYYVVRAEDRQATGTGPCGGVEELNSIEFTGNPISDRSIVDLFDGAEQAPTLTVDAPWATTTVDAKSGTSSFLIPGDTPRTCAGLTAGPFVPTPTSMLSYSHREEAIEENWDGGTVQVSLNGGTSWTTLTPTPDYPTPLDTRSGSCSNDGRGGGVYSADSGGFEDATIDLSAFTGQEVLIRFIFGTDGRRDSTGWYIDDVRITDMAVGQCGPVAAWKLYRSSVAGFTPTWKSDIPLPLAPGPNIDAGWPRDVFAPNREDDLDALGASEPLSLYRLLDETANAVPNRLLMVESAPGVITIRF